MNIREKGIGRLSTALKTRAVIMHGRYYKIEPIEGGTWRIAVDGVSQIFESRDAARQFLLQEKEMRV